MSYYYSPDNQPTTEAVGMGLNLTLERAVCPTTGKGHLFRPIYADFGYMGLSGPQPTQPEFIECEHCDWEFGVAHCRDVRQERPQTRPGRDCRPPDMDTA